MVLIPTTQALVSNYLAAGSNAVETFTYTIRDANGGNDIATATITVHGENDAPVLDNTGNMTLTTITEDQINNSGERLQTSLGPLAATASPMPILEPSKESRSPV